MVHSSHVKRFHRTYEIDHNKIYLNSFNKSLDYAWEHARDEKVYSTQTSPEVPKIIENGY